MNEFVSWQKKSGKPVQVGDVSVTPQSQVLQVRLPFGGFVWQRPVAVVVERHGRAAETLAIVDVTRLAYTCLALVALISAAVQIANLRHSRRKG